MGTFHPSWDNWFTWSLPYATSCEAPNWEFWFASFFLFISFFQVYINGFFLSWLYIYIFFSWIMLLLTSCNNLVWWRKYIHNPKKESYLCSPLVIHWVLHPWWEQGQCPYMLMNGLYYFLTRYTHVMVDIQQQTLSCFVLTCNMI